MRRRRLADAEPERALEPRDAGRRDLRAAAMTSTGPAADAVRRDVRELIAAKGHAVDNARAAVARIEEALEAGDLVRTPDLETYLTDLKLALEQDEGQKLGGKSAEAARFILRAIDRGAGRRLSAPAGVARPRSSVSRDWTHSGSRCERPR